MPWLLLLLLLRPPVPGAWATRDTTIICHQTTRARRHVSQGLRRMILTRDHCSNSKICEVDHLIPLELGGANSVKNLWAEPWPDAHMKDKEENRLHRAVCSGTLNIRKAQSLMAHWGR